MTTYEMTTFDPNGTRIRSDHTTFAPVLSGVPANVIVQGTELWTAPADGSEVKKGDTWLKVTYKGVSGWMAHVHKGFEICRNFHEVGETPPPDTVPPKLIGASITLVYEGGFTQTEKLDVVKITP